MRGDLESQSSLSRLRGRLIYLDFCKLFRPTSAILGIIILNKSKPAWR
jgi:hypothetical protein